MNNDRVTYDSLNVGDKFIHNNELREKCKPLPPVIPVASKVLGTATAKDALLYPTIEEL